MVRKALSPVLILALLMVFADPAVGDGTIVAVAPPQADGDDQCQYELGSFNVPLGISVADPIPLMPDGQANVAACVWRADNFGGQAFLAQALIVDDIFVPVSGVICVDLNDDGVCGDSILGEPQYPFCYASPLVDIGPAVAIAVFIDGPAGTLARCGSFGSGTRGTAYLHLEPQGGDPPPPPPPPPCTWKQKNIHSYLETLGSAWGTRVELTMSFLWGCVGGPLVTPAQVIQCSAPFAYDITQCDHSTPSGGNGDGVYGFFDCTNSSCATAGDHSLQIQIVVNNSGGFTCPATFPSGASATVHCHVH